jgi:hypothetical protein
VVGLIVIGGATELFKMAMDSTVAVTAQAEMQQNVRTSLNLIARDVSMAGAGIPSGGLALPFGIGATASKYGCDQTAKCYLITFRYPTGTVGTTAVSNYMYGLIPGPLNGMEAGGPAVLTATNTTADSVTSVYLDYSFPLNQYTITFPDLTGTSVVAAPPAVPPLGFPAIISPGGLQKGDLVMLSNNKGTAIAEVTNLAAGVGGGATLTFSNGDPLNINQSGAANGNLAYIATTNPAVPTVAYHLWVVSYFVEVPANGQTPRLMRQVSGQAPVPVADNIIGLSVTYDLCDNLIGGTCAGVRDPIGNVPSYSPNQIHKVNIQLIGQSVLASGNKSQSMALGTSVSTRSLSFKSRYQ